MGVSEMAKVTARAITRARTMRALVVPEAGRLELRELPVPTIGDHEALVRIECCGVCSSTDWKVIRGQMGWAGPFPLVLGHESVGSVVEVGPKVRKFSVGDRVTRPIHPRRSGAINSAFGGFGEYGIVTDARAMAHDGDASLLDDYNAQRQNVVPPALQPLEAALAISLSETASVLRGLPNLSGKRIVVAGTGVAGLSLTLWAKLAGAFVVTLGRRAERLDMARRLGADAAIDTTQADYLERARRAAGGRVDGLLEAIGDPAFAEQLLTLLDADGFASAYGAPPDGERFSPRWRTADVREHETYAWVADLLARGWVRPEWFEPQTWPFDRVLDAFEAVRRGEVVKAFVTLA